MKWLMLFCFFSYFPTKVYANIVDCKMYNYSYHGPFFSDAYNVPGIQGEAACQARHQFNTLTLDKEYKKNRDEIQEKITEILSNPTCAPVKKPIEEYAAKLKKYFTFMQKKNEYRTKIVEMLLTIFDAQRNAAFTQAFKALCLGEESNINSFVDLDAVNAMLSLIETPATQVEKDNQTIEDCRHVEALGDHDLKGFVISLKGAKSADFSFNYDTYGIPDQITLKNSNGEVIHDSGCVGTLREKNFTFPVSKLGEDKKLYVNIVNMCRSSDKNGSSWRLELKCQEEKKVPCGQQVKELAELIKQEVYYTKSLLDLDEMEFNCLMYHDNSIFSQLEANGLLQSGIGLLKNYTDKDKPKAKNDSTFFADKYSAQNFTPEKFEEEFSHIKQVLAGTNLIEREATPNYTQAVTESISSPQAISSDLALEKNNVERAPAAIQFDRPIKSECESKPKVLESVLKHISWSYCNVGFRRLGISFD